MGLPPTKNNTMSFNFTNRWHNKNNSFFNNLCKITSFDVIAPKMELSPSLIIVGSITPSMSKLKNSH
jgi:hypothetical protein